jgi:hypothetical protein
MCFTVYSLAILDDVSIYGDVVILETWNGGHKLPYYGKQGELSC